MVARSLALLLLAAGVASGLGQASSPGVLRFRPAPAIHVPAGFRAEIYASGLRKPTALAFGPDGLLYATQETGEVVAVGVGSSRPRVFARRFRVPLGLAWSGRTLYVSAQGSLHRLVLEGGRAVGRTTLLARLPFRLHQQDNVVIGPGGRLYIGSGSTCNACREVDRRSASILSVRAEGTNLRVVATGLRNPFGLAVQPGTGRLYASVNGRDDIGTVRHPEPAEMIVHVRQGRRFGWPNCWPSYRLMRMAGYCRGVTAPIAYLEPHSSPGGLVFYTGSTFPAAYRGNLFVAEWGTYYGRRFGRRVVRLRLRRNGRASPLRGSTFATGFDHPLALAIAKDGSLLVADHGRGVIYRIQARGSS